MNHTEFFKLLKTGAVSGAYLFHGEEEFVKERAYAALVNAALPENADFNLTTLDTDSANDIIDACETLPFMSVKRLVVNRRIPTDKEGRALSDYIGRLPSETLLLFYIKGKADGKLSLVKRIKSAGRDVEFNALDDSEIIRWLISNSQKYGCALSYDNAKYILALVGHKMADISNELSKLAAYSGYRDEITREAIDRVVVRNMEYKLYAMFDALIQGDMRRGALELSSILGAKPDEEAMPAAGYMLGCFRNMLAVADLKAAGLSRNDIIKRLNMREYSMRSVERGLRGCSRGWLLYSIARFSDVAYLQVSGQKNAGAALTDAVMDVFTRPRKPKNA